MLRDPAFFWRPNNTASRGRGEGGKNRSATKFRKNAPQVCNFLNSFVQDCSLPPVLNNHAHKNSKTATTRLTLHQYLQVGPLYFLTTLKVHCFDICCEAVKKQVNFVFSKRDSLGTDGKKSYGPNNVLSMLHHYLCHFSSEEKNSFFSSR